MAETYIQVQVSPALERLLANDGAARRRVMLKAALTHWAEFATAEQRIYAPHGDTGSLEARIGHSGIHYAPGGYGGGGSYEIAAGVRAGASKVPFYVNFGTANTSPMTTAAALAGAIGGPNIQGRIYPRGDRMAATVIASRMPKPRAFLMADTPAIADRGMFNRKQAALTFQKQGEPRKFRAWVSGQRPQPFVYFSYLHTSIYVRGQLRMLAGAMFPGAVQLGTNPDFAGRPFLN